MSRARQVANFDPALLAADEISLDKVNGGTLGTGTIGGSSVVNTSGAITTTGALAGATLTTTGNITMADDTSIGISDSDERIEFDGAGDISLLGCNVGIGTSAPGTGTGNVGFDTGGLEIAKDGNPELILYRATSGTYASAKMSVVSDSGRFLKIEGKDGGTGIQDMVNINLANGNIGIGVVPKATWRSNCKAVQFGTQSALWESGTDNTLFSQNVYEHTDTNRKYINTGEASYYYQYNGGHYWETFASGTGDATLSAASGSMTMLNNGNVGIGTTSSNIRLYIKTTTSDSSAYGIFIDDDAINLMYVRNDGYSFIHSTWNTSDRRKKENISYVTDDILPKIETLKFAKFDLKSGIKNCYGFIAQDVEVIFPDCVNDTKVPDMLYNSNDEIPEGKEIGDLKKEGEEQKNLNYNYLFSYLVKAVQELSAKVTTLENA